MINQLIGKPFSPQSNSLFKPYQFHLCVILPLEVSERLRTKHPQTYAVSMQIVQNIGNLDDNI